MTYLGVAGRWGVQCKVIVEKFTIGYLKKNFKYMIFKSLAGHIRPANVKKGLKWLLSDTSTSSSVPLTCIPEYIFSNYAFMASATLAFKSRSVTQALLARSDNVCRVYSAGSLLSSEKQERLEN
jgi:hypothetical protein